MKADRNVFWALVLGTTLAVTASWGFSQESEKAASPAAGKENSRVYEVDSKTHVRIGGFSIGAGYSHYSSPYTYYWPYSSPYFWDYGWPSLGYWSPIYPPGYWHGLGRGEGKGEIKLDTSENLAEVYIEGAYAGLAQDLKSIWLDPGAYDLELKVTGYQTFRKRIYILSGKLVKVTAVLNPDK